MYALTVPKNIQEFYSGTCFRPEITEEGLLFRSGALPQEKEVLWHDPTN